MNTIPTLAVLFSAAGHSAGAADIRFTCDSTTSGGLPAYRIETSTATYVLEKTGAGLSSMLDEYATVAVTQPVSEDTNEDVDAPTTCQQLLDPVGKLHIPIGIPNSLDSLKTFVEAEGNFSPGIGSYGIYFWVFNPALGSLTSPTMEDVPCTHGLAEGRLMIP
jgi:hypothetical protein